MIQYPWQRRILNYSLKNQSCYSAPIFVCYLLFTSFSQFQYYWVWNRFFATNYDKVVDCFLNVFFYFFWSSVFYWLLQALIAKIFCYLSCIPYIYFLQCFPSHLFSILFTVFNKKLPRLLQSQKLPPFSTTILHHSRIHWLTFWHLCFVL